MMRGSWRLSVGLTLLLGTLGAACGESSNESGGSASTAAGNGGTGATAAGGQGPGGQGPGGAGGGGQGEGIPFGFWDGSVDPLDPPGDWTGAALADSDPASLLDELDACRTLGIKAWFRLTGSPSLFKDPVTGHLDTALWKQTMDPHAPYASQYLPYIEDGTFQGNIMLDDLTNADLWGGQVPTWQEIEDVAQYSKQVIPGLPTAVRAVPSYLLELKGSPYEQLDTAWAQYSERKGDVVVYRDTETQAAKDLGLGLVVGLQLMDGGAITSDCWPGFSPGMCSMKPDEITAFGSVLAAEPYACGMYLWHVDATYLARAGVMDAIVGVAGIARSRSGAPCTR
jgi:hypothetical protein